MKKFWIIVGIISIGIMAGSCNKVRRSTGRAYMPDMYYSRAYETYMTNSEELEKKGIHYTGMPVAGTVARGDMFAYALKNDSLGYAQSGSQVNPLKADSVKIDFVEA